MSMTQFLQTFSYSGICDSVISGNFHSVLSLNVHSTNVKYVMQGVITGLNLTRCRQPQYYLKIYLKAEMKSSEKKNQWFAKITVASEKVFLLFVSVNLVFR